MIERRVTASLLVTPRTTAPFEPGESTFNRTMEMMEARSSRSRLNTETRRVSSDQSLVRIRSTTVEVRDFMTVARFPRITFEWGISTSETVEMVTDRFSTYISRRQANLIYGDPVRALVHQEGNPWTNGGDLSRWLGAIAGTVTDSGAL
ncbi:MAG: hypothetical protein NTV52_17765 [Acidobacteria bacterium]|nr:hypothetical protein [Acidobacteriota bacterium]